MSDNSNLDENLKEEAAPETEQAKESQVEAPQPEENKDAQSEEKDPKAQEEKDSQPEGKPSFFKRKKDKEKEKLETEVAELKDKLLRSRAEFDNFRKRTDKEKASMYIIGAKDIVEKILPIVDNFERGIASAPEGDPFADGMKMVYKQLQTALEDMGVKAIEAVGKEFDPNFHNAVMHVEDETVSDNIVVEELQKGYTYKDFVVRHSMVKVAN